MVGHPQNGGHRLARGEDMAGAGTQSHLPRGVQQGQQAALKGERQIPVPRAVPEWEKAAGKLPLELQLDLIAQLLHRGGGAAVQSQGLLSSSTCVGLRYGYDMNNSGFS